MKNLIRAELLALHTTRTFWGYIAAALALVPVSVALAIASAAVDTPLTSSEGLRGVKRTRRPARSRARRAGAFIYRSLNRRVR